MSACMADSPPLPPCPASHSRRLSVYLHDILALCPTFASRCGFPPLSALRGGQSDRVVDLLLPIDAVIGLLGQAVDTADTAASINIAGEGLAGGGTHPQLEALPGAAPASPSDPVSSIPGGEGMEPFSRVGGEGRGAGSVPWSVSQGATTPYFPPRLPQ